MLKLYNSVQKISNGSKSKIITLVIISILVLHYLVYQFSYFVVNSYFSNNGGHKHLTRIWVYYDEQPPMFHSNEADFGDVKEFQCLNDTSSMGKDTQQKIQDIKNVYPSEYQYLDIGNTTVKNLMFMKQLQYLEDYKNPCFTHKHRNGTSTVYSLKCLPHFFVAGFTKCGTTDFHARLTRHPLIASAWTKEPHWWDDIYRREATLENYADMFQGVLELVNSFYVYKIPSKRKYYPVILGDFTPRTVWHGGEWENDILNRHEREPKILLPNKIKYLLPEAKIIVLIRNPTDRLYSDYIDLTVRYNLKTIKPSPAHFHSLVSNAILWWKNCSATYSERVCSFGSPRTLPALDETHGLKWMNNVADRLRIGLYVIYLKEWFQIFGKDNIRIIRLEQYRNNPLKYITENILPFLELPSFPKSRQREVVEIEPLNAKSVRLDPILNIPMLNSTRNMLDNFYHLYNERLKDMLKMYYTV